MSTRHHEEVKELAAKLLPGMRERAKIYMDEAGKNMNPGAEVFLDVILRTMADEFACAIIGMRS